MRWIDCGILRNIYNSYLQEVIMKRKRNHSLRSSVFIFLAALFLLFTCSVSTIYASTLQKPDIAASGKFVKDGNYWIYRYDDKTIAKNIFLKIDKKTYYFNKLGHRWCSCSSPTSGAPCRRPWWTCASTSASEQGKC